MREMFGRDPFNDSGYETSRRESLRSAYRDIAARERRQRLEDRNIIRIHSLPSLNPKPKQWPGDEEGSSR